MALTLGHLVPALLPEGEGSKSPLPPFGRLRAGRKRVRVRARGCQHANAHKLQKLKQTDEPLALREDNSTNLQADSKNSIWR